MTTPTTEASTGRALRPPRAGRSNGQWAVDGTEPLNANEAWKQEDGGLNVRERIEQVYAKEGFASIPPQDLSGRFRWWGLYTQRKPGIDGGRTAQLDDTELSDEYFMLRVRIDGGALTTEAGDDKITVGSGSSLQNVDVGDGSDNLTLGNNNTLGGIVLGAGGANGDLVTAGTGNTVTGNITQAVSDAYSKVTFGDQTRLNGNVELNGGRDTLTLGDSSTVTGSITTGSDLSSDDADVLNIGAGSSIGGYINTNTGNDTVTIGDNTTLSGGWNAINTELGDDVINLGAGVVATNPIFTGAGSDTVNASTGNFVVEQGDVVPNDDMTVITAAPGAYKDLIAALNKQGFVDPDGDGRYYNGANQTFTYGGVTYRQIDYIEAVPCFARGTLIRTPRGDVAIEDLAVGDLVDTCDRGAQAIRWIGSRFLDGNALAEMPHLRPIRIRRGALGSGLPTADLLVSPQHRVLVRSRIAQKMFGTDEVLVAAKQLCQIDGIDIDQDVAHVEYFHMLFDAHEVVVSNGAETESLFTGEEALKSVGPAARDEIFALFPELADPDHVSIAARTLASGRMGRKLAVRHANNGKPLVM